MLKSYQILFESMMKLGFRIFFIVCLLFSACSIYDTSYKPNLLQDKKTLSSRKAELIKDGKTIAIALATYLNNVDSNIYDENREYFLLEIFSQEPLLLPEILSFKITNDANFLWIREINDGEFEREISLNNKWARAFLIAFEPVGFEFKRVIKLEVLAQDLGKMEFDFSYKVFEMQF